MTNVFLDLGLQPLANNFVNKIDLNEYKYNLRMKFDDDNKLVSQLDKVQSDLMFNEEYLYRAGTSKTNKKHFKNLADLLKGYCFPLKVLEIGSNDGTFLSNFDINECVGVEPCSNFAHECREKGYTIYDDFWTVNTANKIAEKHGKFDFIFASNCISHIPDLDNTFAAIGESLKDDGVFIMEDPSLMHIMQNNTWDMFYDAHVNSFSTTAIHNVIQTSSLKVYKVDQLKTHGGSNRYWIGKYNCTYASLRKNLEQEKYLGLNNLSTYKEWGEKIEEHKEKLLKLLHNIKNDNKTIVGYGAAAKTNTVYNYCGIDSNLISYIVDVTPEKQNKFTPGTYIPIVEYNVDSLNNIEYSFLSAWNFTEEIMEKELYFINNGGKFISHAPNVRLI